MFNKYRSSVPQKGEEGWEKVDIAGIFNCLETRR